MTDWLGILVDTSIDTAKLIPFLLIVYVGIELVEYYFGGKIRQFLQRVGRAGPAVGAVAGTLPQCGFSVMTTALYTQRLVTVGTLIAVYLSTSDEAIPVILSQPDKALLILPLILTKLVIAIPAGYLIDLAFRKQNTKTLAHIDAYSHGHDDVSHNHDTIIDQKACCGHHPDAKAKRFDCKQLIVHPLVHTAKILLYIFIFTLALNIGIALIGQETLHKILLSNSILQPFVAGLVGLIPNCAASVALTQLYLNGSLSFGSVIAGLCASGGLGILVLFKEEKSWKERLMIVGLLYGISVLAGIILSLTKF